MQAEIVCEDSTAAKQHQFAPRDESGDRERVGLEKLPSPASPHLASPLPLSFSFSFSWQEKPKSVSLMFMSSSRRMFSGFRSRWTMLMECRYWITSSSARMIFLGMGMGTAHSLSQTSPGTTIPGMGTGTEHRGTAVLAARPCLKPTLCSCKVLFPPLHLQASPGFFLAQGDFLSEVVKELPSLHPARGRGNRVRQRPS